jgi:hypothetical protein
MNSWIAQILLAKIVKRSLDLILFGMSYDIIHLPKKFLRFFSHNIILKSFLQIFLCPIFFFTYFLFPLCNYSLYFKIGQTLDEGYFFKNIIIDKCINIFGLFSWWPMQLQNQLAWFSFICCSFLVSSVLFCKTIIIAPKT